jgi:hypothetical protein
MWKVGRSRMNRKPVSEQYMVPDCHQAFVQTKYFYHQVQYVYHAWHPTGAARCLVWQTRYAPAWLLAGRPPVHWCVTRLMSQFVLWKRAIESTDMMMGAPIDRIWTICATLKSAASWDGSPCVSIHSRNAQLVRVIQISVTFTLDVYVLFICLEVSP